MLCPLCIFLLVSYRKYTVIKSRKNDNIEHEVSVTEDRRTLIKQAELLRRYELNHLIFYYLNSVKYLLEY